MMYKGAVLSALLMAGVNSDMYLHWPRGCNNRLNEASANRNNANRLFDSQNNNRGGYNVGDMDPVNGFNGNNYIATFTEMYDFEFLSEANQLTKQYEMLFFEESSISVTWTSQHGAGNKKLNSMFVLQFACDTFARRTTAQGGADGSGPSFTGTNTMQYTMRKHGLRMELDNGGNTNTPNEPNALNANTGNNNIQNTYTGNNDAQRGRRESEEYYAMCKTRLANKGLFHADQNLQGYTQIYTRQNPGGTRRGLECPEERDYFPWWNPSPFHDIAVITPDVDYCESTIAPNSQNVMEKYQCVSTSTAGDTPANWLPTEAQAQANLDQAACTAAGGSWEGFKWNGAEPDCVDSAWNKVNHLGNVDGTKRGGKMAHYDWMLPSLETLVDDHYCNEYTYNIENSADSSVDAAVNNIACVRMSFRIRYNMSTMDYDPYMTNSSMDEDNNEGIISPIENNPTVDVGIYAQGLRLAINTAQTGRVFQDNSHTFLVCERPNSAFQNRDLLNVGVRGKRGNIVQTFPAIEYDFEPQHIFIEPGQCMHFQWTGSNTHNNGAPGGDGQTGDAGEGRGGSDRSTLVQSLMLDESYPVAYDNLEDDYNFFDQVNCYHPFFSGNDAIDKEDAQLTLGTAGFYRHVDDIQANINSANNGFLQELLNNASASFRQGLVCCVKGDANEMEYNFISTRNNNFTNRSQKLKIIITDDAEDPALW